MSSGRVIVFGTFDLLHKGHLYILEEASKLGNELYVGIALDEHVQYLKQKQSKHTQTERLAAVSKLPMVTKALLCDKTLGTYSILQQIKPDIIALGHDQFGLKESIEEWMRRTGNSFRLTILPKYEAQNMDRTR